MFKSTKIQHFVQSCKFAGDADKSTLQVAFYVTPLNFDLLYEVDDRVAKQLFRKEGGAYVPVAELDDATLKLGDIGAFNLELYPHAEEGSDGAGQMIPNCRITKVEASKLFTDKEDWSLIWHATIPMDSHSLELIRKYYKRTVFVTLEKIEEALFETDDKKPIILSDAEIKIDKDHPVWCSVCPGEITATYLASDQAGYCDPHVHAAVGVQVRKIVYGDAA